MFKSRLPPKLLAPSRTVSPRRVWLLPVSLNCTTMSCPVRETPGIPRSRISPRAYRALFPLISTASISAPESNMPLALGLISPFINAGPIPINTLAFDNVNRCRAPSSTQLKLSTSTTTKSPKVRLTSEANHSKTSVSVSSKVISITLPAISIVS